MHNNKAAKFFETKKAEQKAASALSKEKAAKSGAKVSFSDFSNNLVFQML